MFTLQTNIVVITVGRALCICSCSSAMWAVIKQWAGEDHRPRWLIVPNEHLWWTHNDVYTRQLIHDLISRARQLSDESGVRHRCITGLLQWPIGEPLPEPPRRVPDASYGRGGRVIVARNGPY